MLFSDKLVNVEPVKKEEEPDTFDEEIIRMRNLLKTKLTDLDLSVRALNCLKAAEVETLGDLVTYTKQDLMKFRNFGKKSLTELDELIESKGLHFGMDLSKYKLDKE
jgi:DNA-directed RNA polymerase subunit alpha